MAYRSWRRSGTKYNAQKVICDGITFDSKKEAQRYGVLKYLERAGEISELKLQVEYELIPNQYTTEERYGKNGRRLKDKQILLERKCCYIADFVYVDNRTGKMVVEDAKGMRVEPYQVKKKLMLWVHGIQIKEV